jgi:spore germination protein KC
MRWRYLLGLIMILCFLQTGCWSRKELNQISIPMAQALDWDRENGKIIMTVQIANPTAMGKTNESKSGGEQPFYIAASSGFTQGEAERNLYKQVTRPLFWQHIRVTIISEDFARNNLASSIDYLDRALVLRRNMLLLVTPGRASEVLTIEHPVEKMSGQAIFYLAKEAFKHSETYSPSNTNDFLIALSTKGIEPVLARLTVKELKASGPEEGQQTKSGGQMAKILELSGSAVFKAEKMIGWLNDAETRGLLWVRGKTKNAMLILKYPGSGNKAELVTILNQNTNTQIKPEFTNGKLQITVAIKAEGRLSGASFNEKDPTQTDILKSLDRQYASAIKREIRLALVKAQDDYDADIFGFGLAISRKYPKLWKKLEPKWDDEFRLLDVNLKVTAHIRRTGLTLKPTKRE